MTTPPATPRSNASASRWGARGSKVTIEDVARAAGVSRQTVTNTLSYPHRVRADTRERVEAEIQRLGYRPSAAARSMRSRVSGALGIELRTLGPGYHNALMAPLLAELSRAAGLRGAHMVTFGEATEESSLAAYEHMWLTRRVDAFVLTDTEPGDPRPRWLAEQGAPFVSFGRVWSDPAFSQWVDVDGGAGTDLAVRHCRDRGYERVAFLGWEPGRSPVMDDRRDGWAAACGEAGLPTGGLEGRCDDDLGSVTSAALRLLDELGGPGGAVVCTSDLVAVGVHHALALRGLRVGADVGLVGFDDSETARLHGLTSVRQPLDRIAEELVLRLEHHFDGEHETGVGLLLRPTLHERASTGGPEGREDKS
ncbi:MAG: LacI family DNA-binding transcriptional regulator [Nocardioides sp.]